MKKSILTALAIASTLLTSTVQAEELSTGPYFSVDGGAVFMNDIGGYKYDTGFGGNLAIGQRLNNTFSIELQAGYYTADFAYDFNNPVANRFAQIYGTDVFAPVFANVKADFPLGQNSPVRFELGVGAGAVYSDTTIDFDIVGIRDFFVNADGWGFGAQAMAGFSYQISSNVEFKLGYRFLNVEITGSTQRGHYVGLGFNIRS
jgi:opacity protein-like surface antigen